ncbi:nitroreductase family protein [Carnimonas nigrificans]|uniref:nitroreductase family protein n=1 Tax=Carnimonas nigrificans TaxID=64323 RepID=UPI0004728747|nr:nitroreductase family protein [Carnimonas nigrificans]
MSERQPQYPADALFVNRWSPRSLTGEAIDDQTLLTLFEAARWAPSAFNVQPWRFSYSKNDSESFSTYLDFLVEFNQSWAKNASALIVVLAKKITMTSQAEVEFPSYAFDTGAAWASLAFQAEKLGWVTHGMTGINKEKIAATLKVPETYSVEAMIAVGKQGDKAALPEGLQAKEAPSDRRPVEETIFEGIGFKE